MNIHEIKRLVKKWVKWSGEKQLEVFMKTEKSRTFFAEAMKTSKK